MAAAPLLDLSALPPPDVVEALSYDVILADMVQQATDLCPAPQRDAFAAALALESEPARIVLEVCAYRELLLRNRVNQAARGNMLATAVESDLDNVAANLQVQRLIDETDDELRARCALAPTGYSVAGPELAYRFHAESADSRVSDVEVTTPAPGHVQILVLSDAADGSAPADLLAAVTAAVTPGGVRPLTDFVTVGGATIAGYSVTATLYLANGLDGGAITAAALKALQAYAASRRRIGKGVATDGILAALRPPGVEKVVLASPASDIEAAPGVAPVMIGVPVLTPVVGGGGV